MKIIKEIRDHNYNRRLSKYFDMKNPVDRAIYEEIKAGKLTFAVVDLKEWICEICGASNNDESRYCWFCEAYNEAHLKHN